MLRKVLWILLPIAAMAAPCLAKTLVVAGRISSEMTVTQQVTFGVNEKLSELVYRFPVPAAIRVPSISQRLADHSITFDPQPESVADETDAYGNLYKIVTWKKLSGDARANIVYTAALDAVLDPLVARAAFPLKGVPEAERFYLKASKQVQSGDAKIVALAAELTAGAVTASAAVDAILNFVTDHVRYESPPKSYDALFGLASGTGNCQNYAHLACALLRASGIPARVAVGLTLKDKWKIPLDNHGSSLVQGMAEGLHAWIEVWFPGLGWLPCDPQQSKQFTSTRHIKYAHGLECSGIGISWKAAPVLPRYSTVISSNFSRDSVQLSLKGSGAEPRGYMASFEMISSALQGAPPPALAPPPAAEPKADPEAERKLAERKLAELRLAEQKQAELRLAERKVAELKLAEQKLAEQRLAERKLEELRAAERKLAEQKLAEQKAAERKLAEQKLAEQRLAERRLAERKLAELIEQELTEKKSAELKLAERKLAELKLAEQNLARQKLAEQKQVEQRLAEKRLAERKLAEQKLAERTLAERNLAERRLAELRLAEGKLEELKLAEQRLAEWRLAKLQTPVRAAGKEKPKPAAQRRKKPAGETPVKPDKDGLVVFGNMRFPATLNLYTNSGDRGEASLDRETAEYATSGSIYAQAFLIDRPLRLEKVSLAAKKFGGDGTVYLDIVADDHGKPGITNGVRSQPVYLENVRRQPGYGWLDFNIPADAEPFQPGKYWVVLRRSGEAILNWYYTPGKPYGGPDDTRSTARGWQWEDILTYDFVFKVAGREAQ